MPVERSAGIIVFRNTPEGRKYLLLHSSGRNFWDVPKGVLESGEQGINAAIREVQEETGLRDIRIVPEFKETLRYFVRRGGKTIQKFVALFLGEANPAPACKSGVNRDTIKLSWEHDRYEWLTYEHIEQKISFSELKRAFAAADKFLNIQ